MNLLKIISTFHFLNRPQLNYMHNLGRWEARDQRQKEGLSGKTWTAASQPTPPCRTYLQTDELVLWQTKQQHSSLCTLPTHLLHQEAEDSRACSISVSPGVGQDPLVKL